MQSLSQRSRKIRRKSFIVMIGGLFLLFASLYVMNGIEALSKDGEKKVTRFHVESPPEKKKKKELTQNRQTKKQPPKKQLAPPNLNALLQGSSFGLSLYQVDLSELSESLLGEVNQSTMTEGTVDVPPQVIRRPTLRFPPIALTKKLSGFVTVKLLVNDEGRVEKVKINEAQPEGVFEEATLEAVREWVFKPAEYQGKRVAVWVEQRVTFNL